MQGIVKNWSERGYGFIVGQDGQSYFCHWSSILKDGFKSLEKDQVVEFIPEAGDKGPRAVDVSVCR